MELAAKSRCRESEVTHRLDQNPVSAAFAARVLIWRGKKLATLARERPAFSVAPRMFDRVLAVIAAVLLALLLAALVRGSAKWVWVPPFVWAHLLTIAVALVLTPVMLLRRRGDRLHRVLGWIWVSAMMLTALLSFGVRGLNGTSLSWIHILSALTILQAPRIVITARRKQHRKHQAAVRTLITGALAIAGVFTLVPGRMIGDWLFG